MDKYVKKCFKIIVLVSAIRIISHFKFGKNIWSVKASFINQLIANYLAGQRWTPSSMEYIRLFSSSRWRSKNITGAKPLHEEANQNIYVNRLVDCKINFLIFSRLFNETSEINCLRYFFYFCMGSTLILFNFYLHRGISIPSILLA